MMLKNFNTRPATRDLLRRTINALVEQLSPWRGAQVLKIPLLVSGYANAKSLSSLAPTATRGKLQVQCTGDVGKESTAQMATDPCDARVILFASSLQVV